MPVFPGSPRPSHCSPSPVCAPAGPQLEGQAPRSMAVEWQHLHVNSWGPMVLAHQRGVYFRDLKTTFVSIRKKQISQDAPGPKLHTHQVFFKLTEFIILQGSPYEIEATSRAGPESCHFPGRATEIRAQKQLPFIFCTTARSSIRTKDPCFLRMGTQDSPVK